MERPLPAVLQNFLFGVYEIVHKSIFSEMLQFYNFIMKQLNIYAVHGTPTLTSKPKILSSIVVPNNPSKDLLSYKKYRRTIFKQQASSIFATKDVSRD